MINFHQLDNNLRRAWALMSMELIKHYEKEQTTVGIDVSVEQKEARWDELQSRIDILREGMK